MYTSHYTYRIYPAGEDPNSAKPIESGMIGMFREPVKGDKINFQGEICLVDSIIPMDAQGHDGGTYPVLVLFKIASPVQP
jgi:hypothetical protein